jgi:DNA-binding GntR family transcriptional regulator
VRVVRAASLQDRVLAVVGAAISDRSLAPGSVLLEAVLADALITSRTPVRAALEELRATGRVRKLDGRGYVVLDPDGRSPARRMKIDRDRFVALVPARPGPRAPAVWSAIFRELQREFASAATLGPLRILESEIARHYGVSRTVVRDVLLRAERIGLIAKDDRFHWRLVPLTPERAVHLQQLRRALEPVALRSAAEKGLLGDLDDMRDRLLAARSRGPDVPKNEVQGLERDLHVETLGRCGNPELMKALSFAHVQLTANRRLYQLMSERFPIIVEEHLAIVESLLARDVDGAVNTLQGHLGPTRMKWFCEAIEAAAESGDPPLRYLVRD